MIDYELNLAVISLLMQKNKESARKPSPLSLWSLVLTSELFALFILKVLSQIS